MADIANDGIEELILGYLYDGEYRATAIYAYDEGIVIPVEKYYYYWKMQKNSGLRTYQETVSDIPKNWGGGDEEGMFYYRETADSDEEEEITEEYNRIKEQYETTPIELEWKVLEGFWNPEDEVSP